MDYDSEKIKSISNAMDEFLTLNENELNLLVREFIFSKVDNNQNDCNRFLNLIHVFDMCENQIIALNECIQHTKSSLAISSFHELLNGINDGEIMDIMINRLNVKKKNMEENNE